MIPRWGRKLAIFIGNYDLKAFILVKKYNPHKGTETQSVKKHN